MWLIIGKVVLTYWSAAGIIRGALQAVQGVALAAGCVANGDAQAGLTCLVGGAAAPGVGVLHEVEQTVASLKTAAMAIGRPATSPLQIPGRPATHNHVPQHQP
jgi:hypothetical protein